MPRKKNQTLLARVVGRLLADPGRHGQNKARKRTPVRVSPKPKPVRRNPNGALAAVRAKSRVFHGRGAGTVLRLDARDRRLPAYVLPVGKVVAITYEPPAGSRRAGSLWRHEAGDAGALRRTPRGTYLVSDGRGRIQLFQPRNRMRLDPRRGPIG